MFDLFVLWLYHRQTFSAAVDRALSAIVAAEADTGDHEAGSARLRGLRWALVHLHLFAAAVDLPALQDASMDAIQDLYLRLDWDVSPRFVRSLYERRAAEAFRLRKWAVAMVAWTLSSGGASGRCNGDDDNDDGDDNDLMSQEDREAAAEAIASQFQHLMDRFREFHDDYTAHLRKMAGSRSSVCIKNPQLRIPTNSLRNDERNFGFRMCSFHSHRASVGQGQCPHSKGDESSRHSVMVMPISSSPCPVKSHTRSFSRDTNSGASVSSDCRTTPSPSPPPQDEDEEEENPTLGVAMTATRHRSRSDLGFKPVRFSSHFSSARLQSTLPTIPPTPNDPATTSFF
ncbi:hypothetical protein MCOR25_008593 [Pyricularia grisea]|nr:hypothetical protein MCOR25_008593 [Pyricularia grisea]